ncbi:hypothetical protein GGX14DRAFT_406517 [Mycena pura]|uniref:Uncharacterized protein n=1 Tax=Mycena pura TaxID=153505 RepID=A0AAD6UQA2_9AGAR|nr:hypothetical protein GGX14DRAFT_406517 [Mycena pura]
MAAGGRWQHALPWWVPALLPPKDATDVQCATFTAAADRWHDVIHIAAMDLDGPGTAANGDLILRFLTIQRFLTLQIPANPPLLRCYAPGRPGRQTACAHSKQVLRSQSQLSQPETKIAGTGEYALRNDDARLVYGAIALWDLLGANDAPD